MAADEPVAYRVSTSLRSTMQQRRPLSPSTSTSFTTLPFSNSLVP